MSGGPDFKWLQLAPQQQAIELPVPNTCGEAADNKGINAGELPWWQFFNNSKLQQLISAQQTLLASQIGLYKVLGGGWQNAKNVTE